MELEVLRNKEFPTWFKEFVSYVWKLFKLKNSYLSMSNYHTDTNA